MGQLASGTCITVSSDSGTCTYSIGNPVSSSEIEISPVKKPDSHQDPSFKERLKALRSQAYGRPGIKKTVSDRFVNDLDEAFRLANRKFTMLNSKNRHKRRYRPSFRILDHGPTWEMQRCNSRFSIVRWAGPNPTEWERVGWNVGLAKFVTRREARQALLDLVNIASVMES